MDYSLNDRIRSKLMNYNTLEEMYEGLSQLNVEENEQEIRLILLDSCKIEFLESKHQSIFTLQKSVDELIEDFVIDSEFFNSVLINFLAYNCLCTVSKIILMEKIEEYDKNECFLNISKTHLFDKICYSFSYDLEDFKNYYVDYITKRDDKKEITNVSIFIANKLLEYRLNNYNKFKQIILEFVVTYYKCNIFAMSKINYHEQKNFKYLEMIKLNTLDSIIVQSENDFCFLTILVENYLHYSTQLKEKIGYIVEEYYSNNVDEEIQKKLKRD